MHTPRPAPDPLSAVDMYDSSWAIFDQNSIALALGNGFGNGSHAAAGGMVSSGEGGSGNGMVIFTAGNGNAGSVVGGAEVGNSAGGSGVEVSGGAASVEEEYTGGESLDGDGQWFGNEHYADAWQNTLFRLFGNVEMPMTGNEFVPTGT